jgi:hypothetical protein
MEMSHHIYKWAAISTLYVTLFQRNYHTQNWTYYLHIIE